MRDCVRLSFPAFSEQYESFCDWMYLDVEGFVTVGLGNLIDPIGAAFAPPLHWVLPGGASATWDDVRRAWSVVKSRTDLAKLGGGHFQHIPGNEIRATRDSILALVDRKMNSCDAALRSLFSEWETWPAECQTATLSMAWAMGVRRIQLNFPHFMSACKAKDWLAASAECHMSEVGQNDSFRARNAKNKELFKEACQLDSA